MIRTVLIVGAALMVAGFLLAGAVTVLARCTMTPQQVSFWRAWALGIGVIGFMVLCLALVNWPLYHPDNIQLPFVNER